MKQRTRPQMCKVTPLTTSKLIDGLRQYKKQKCLLNCIGISCIPFCCTGIGCISIAAQLAPVTEALEDVVHFYGGEANVQRLAGKIIHEQHIFARAVNSVNATISPELINTKLTLLDCIIANVPRTGRIIDEAQFLTSRLRTSSSQHGSAVWDIYLSMGGDYKVVVYGLIEYLSQNYDPTSQTVLHVVNQLNKNSPLRNECQLHKC